MVLMLSPLLRLGELCSIDLSLLPALQASVYVVCGFVVVLVILKFIKAQGRILKIKLKYL